MQDSIRRFISVILAVALSVCLLAPASAFAEEQDTEAAQGAVDGTGRLEAGSTDGQQEAGPTGIGQSVSDSDVPAGSLDPASEQDEADDSLEGDARFASLEEAVDAGVAAALPENPLAYASDQILVAIAGGASMEDGILAVEEEIDGISELAVPYTESLAGDGAGSNFALLGLPEDVSVADALLAAANSGLVEYAQPNYKYYLEEELAPESGYEPMFTPNDPKLSDQWWLTRVNAFAAWDTLGSAMSAKPVTVAVVDTGMRLTHQDLAGNLWTASGDPFITNGMAVAWDVTTTPANVLRPTSTIYGGDDESHGTHVAGIVSAQTNNGKNGSGVSNNAKLLPVRVFSGATSSSDVLVKAYNYLLAYKRDNNRYNIRVINLSLGGYDSADGDVAFHTKIIEAQNNGMLTVVSAGNRGNSSSYQDAAGNTLASFPSDYDEVVSVAATDSNNGHASYSDHNSYKNIAAPGTSINSTLSSSDGAFGSKGGTSMAAPIVSGIAAMMFAKKPSMTVAEAKSILYSTARDQVGDSQLDTPGWDPYFGWGLVDAEAALAVAAGGSYSPITETPTPILPVPKSQPRITMCHPGYNFPSVDATPHNAADITAAGGRLSYQWYYTTSTSSFESAVASGSKIVGETNAVLNPSSTTPTGVWTDTANVRHTFVYFFCQITNTASDGKTATVLSDLAYQEAYSKSSPLTITAGSASKIYNGTQLVKSTYTKSTLPAGVDALEVWTSGSQTQVGVSDNKVSQYKLWTGTANKIEVTSYYTNVTCVPGTLTVMPNIIGKVATLGSGIDASKTMDIANGSLDSSAAAQIYNANNSPAQRFRFVNDASSEYYYIFNVRSGKALDVRNGIAGAGSRIQQYTPNGSMAQKWLITQKSATQVVIKSAMNTSLVLDIIGGSNSNGAGLQLYPANDTAAQSFRLNICDNSLNGQTRALRSSASNNVLDIANASLDSGANVWIYAPNGSAAQQFRFVYDNMTGYYSIINPRSGKALDVAGGSGAAGANIWQYTANGSPAQLWSVEQVPGHANTFYIRSALGNCLDVQYAGTGSGTNVWSYPYNASPAQRWVLQ